MNRAKGFIEFIEMADKSPRLDSSTRKMANKCLSEISRKYHREMLLGDIFTTLKEKLGIVVLQEEWN